MTKRLFDSDSHLLDFRAVVLSCEKTEEGYAIILDETAFCPEGGGQPSDIGTLDGIAVIDVRERGKTIAHITAQAIPMGRSVQGKVGAMRRLRHMQNHTGEHIVTGIFYNSYGFHNVGFHLGHEDVTLDLDGEVDNATLRLVEWQANLIVAENRAVTAYYPSPDLLSSLPYRSKGEIEGNVRIVEIEGHDRCACCVPHVKFTGEVGGIRLLSSMRYKGGTRIHMKCGLDAIADANVDADRMAALSRLLSLPNERILEGVKKLSDDLASVRYELTALRREIAMTHAEEADVRGTVCLFEKGADLPSLRRMADRLVERGAIRVMLCSESGDGYYFVYTDSEDFSSSSAALRAALDLRGGGKPPFMQGTIKATREDIAAYFQK